MYVKAIKNEEMNCLITEGSYHNEILTLQRKQIFHDSFQYNHKYLIFQTKSLGRVQYLTQN